LFALEGCNGNLVRRARSKGDDTDFGSGGTAILVDQTKPPEMTMQQSFTSRYRGKRYSFGHPACESRGSGEHLENVEAGQISVQLTEGFMMDPEASASAVVFQYPDCSYFSLGETGVGIE
jgi:hypothetical protein